MSAVFLPDEAVARLKRAGARSGDDARLQIMRACAANEVYARGLKTTRNMTAQSELEAHAHETIIPSFYWDDLLAAEDPTFDPDRPVFADVAFLWTACELTAMRTLPHGHVQEHWRAVVFDRERVENLALRVAELAPATPRPTASVKQEVVKDWIRQWPGSNVERAWAAFKQVPEFKGYMRAAFREDWREVTGKHGRGARTSRDVAAANFVRS